jgi:tRNA dimethylallyltransferase
MGSRARVLAIVGPTGTGKTELSCAVARRTGAEVISADSLQVYRYMDVGTAKPSPELRAEIPHHLIDVCAPDGLMSAGLYASLARRAALDIQRRGRAIVLCGGSGLYARAFAGGLVSGIESKPALRRELESRPTEELRAELRRRDPKAASRIHPNDRVRVVRALEALELGSEPLSERQREHGFRDRPFDVRWLALDLERERLWQALERRVDRMFQEGLVEEVRRLQEAGYGPELRPLRSIGYRESALVLAGRLEEGEARAAVYVATRRYAKRQRCWFRAEPGVEWIDASRTDAALERALAMLAA